MSCLLLTLGSPYVRPPLPGHPGLYDFYAAAAARPRPVVPVVAVAGGAGDGKVREGGAGGVTYQFIESCKLARGTMYNVSTTSIPTQFMVSNSGTSQHPPLHVLLLDYLCLSSAGCLGADRPVGSGARGTAPGTCRTCTFYMHSLSSGLLAALQSVPLTAG